MAGKTVVRVDIGDCIVDMATVAAGGVCCDHINRTLCLVIHRAMMRRCKETLIIIGCTVVVAGNTGIWATFIVGGTADQGVIIGRIGMTQEAVIAVNHLDHLGLVLWLALVVTVSTLCIAEFSPASRDMIRMVQSPGPVTADTGIG